MGEKRGLKRRQCSFNDENSPEPVNNPKQETCRNLSDSISKMLSSDSSKCSFTPESYQSPTKKVSFSPVKRLHVTPRRIGSPLKLFSPLRERSIPQSPTANLPNFNIDGRSPRAIVSCRKQMNKPGTNWLTAFAKEKKQGGENGSQDKLKAAISGLSSKDSKCFTKIKQKPGKKKVVKLK